MSDTIGRRFRAFRAIIGLSQKDTAQLLNITRQSTISDWENDKSEPPLSSLLILHKYHYLNIHWLLTGEGLPNITDKDVQSAKPGTYTPLPPYPCAQQSLPDEPDNLSDIINDINNKIANPVPTSETLGILVKKTIDVLESGTEYANALESNINQFHKGVLDEKKLHEKVSAQDEKINNIMTEIEALKKLSTVKPSGQSDILKAGPSVTIPGGVRELEIPPGKEQPKQSSDSEETLEWVKKGPEKSIPGALNSEGKKNLS